MVDHKVAFLFFFFFVIRSLTIVMKSR